MIRKTKCGVSTPESLSSRAVLVHLNQHYWFGKISDLKITDEVNKKYSADGSYEKRLIPAKEMKEMGSAFTVVRNIHNRYTLPWSGDGWHILASAAYYQWDKELREAIAVAEQKADAFAQKWEDLVNQMAKTDKSFDPDHYPSKKVIRAKYGFDIHYKPVPVGGDVRISISNDALAAIQANVNNDQQQYVETMMLDIAERIKDVVGKLVTKLREYKPAKKDKKAENSFKDSLVENVRDLAGLLPKLNPGGVIKIDQMAAELLKILPASADTLRDDDKVRQQTADAAEKILSHVGD